MTKTKILAFRLLIVTLFILTFNLGPGEASDNKYRRTVETYTVPDVVLVNQDGRKVRLKELLNSNKPVIMDYIFGTCTTICPILSAGFANLQNKLGPDSQKIQLVSISIDPENDTPKVMKDYLKRYRAKPGWDFLTGSRANIDKVMKAFDAYIPNKMSHYPLTLIRSPQEDKWIRIMGLLSTTEFIEETRKLGGM